MSSDLTSTTTTKVHPEPMSENTDDHFDRLPDSILLLIFNNIGDVKSLGRCCVVSRRFHSLIPLVENVVVRVDCVIPDDNDPNSSSTTSTSKSRSPFSFLARAIFTNILKPLKALLTPKQPLIPPPPGNDDVTVTHHSPTQVLKNFNDLKSLRIELPSGELGIDEGVLLKWRAHFGSTLDDCVILGASSVLTKSNEDNPVTTGLTESVEDNGSIPESFYMNGGLKLRVVWTISSLIAASARHYLLQPIIGEHRGLDSLVLTDGDGQGVLCMDRDQLEELRVKPLSASSAAKRTLVPALNMRLWYAPELELPGGVVLKGATLVAIRPSEQNGNKESLDLEWVSSAFEEPYGTAAKMLIKRRTYCLEMNSF